MRVSKHQQTFHCWVSYSIIAQSLVFTERPFDGHPYWCMLTSNDVLFGPDVKYNSGKMSQIFVFSTQVPHLIKSDHLVASVFVFLYICIKLRVKQGGMLRESIGW